MLPDQEIERDIKRIDAVPTLADIARRAGLSQRTVRRIARGHKVAPTTYRLLAPVIVQIRAELR